MRAICLPAWFRMTAKSALLGTLAWSPAIAEKSNPSPADSVAQLSATYAKLDGFKATYRSSGKDEVLECTVGMDEVSGIGVKHVVGKKANRDVDSRQWSTAKDEWFIGGDNFFVVEGITGELKCLTDLGKVLTLTPQGFEVPRSQFVPSVLLKKKASIESVIAASDKPTWVSALMDASIKASDEKTVTFLSPKYGLLTISRENGLLIRQEATMDDGEVRVVELKDVQLNPGREVIEEIYSSWSTVGAGKKDPRILMASIRLRFFQQIIDAMEENHADLGKLETLLEQENEALRHFGETCISKTPGTLASDEMWKSLLDQDLMRKAWLQIVPNPESEDDKAFERFLANPKLREKTRASRAAELLKHDKWIERVMWDIIGLPGSEQLKTKSKAGEGAKHVIRKELARVYLEELLDLKMAELWDGEREGMD